DAHTLQLSVNRRFRNRLSFGFNNPILLYEKSRTNARRQHHAGGNKSEPPKQAQADDLFGNFVPTRHTFKGDFVWALPHFDGSSTATRALSQIARDWQLQGVRAAHNSTA